MAVILKNTARAASRVNTVPIRSTTMKIAQTGLVTNRTDNTGKSVGVINMGYRGDNKVTRLIVQLWKQSSVFTANYDAAMVFFHELSKTRVTLDMSSDDANFYIDIPESITIQNGNYQLYFVLREKVSLTDANESMVGVADDPAYREVFVSDVSRGVVDERSGFQFIGSNFDWNKTYNYNIGAINIDTWQEAVAPNQYFTTVFLGGLIGENLEVASGIEPSEEQIIVNLPDGVTLVSGVVETKSLMLTVECAAEEADALLESILVTYPVMFSASINNEAAAQKTPIKLILKDNHIETVDNNLLGMLHDAYVTPVDVSGLINLPTSTTKTDKYVIFYLAAGSNTEESCYVCKAIDDICWIPIAVTSIPANWQVSCVVKSEEYSYYTNVIGLPVVSNALTKMDIFSDSQYAAVQDFTLEYLYDSNNFAMYAMAEDTGTVKINYPGSNINKAIGWAYGISEIYKAEDLVDIADWTATVAEKYTKEDVIDTLNKVGTLEQQLNNADVSIMRDEVDSLKDTAIQQANLNADLIKKDSDQDKAIADLDLRLKNADVTTLTGRVDTLEISLTTINSELSDRITSVDQGFAQALSNQNASIRNDFAAADNALQEEIKQTKAIVEQNVKTLAGVGSTIETLQGKDAQLEMLINTKVNSGTYQDTVNLLGEQIATEITNRVEEDGKILQKLTEETERAKAEEKRIEDKFNEQISDANDAIAAAELNAKEYSDTKIGEYVPTINDNTDRINIIEQSLTNTHIPAIEDNKNNIDLIKKDLEDLTPIVTEAHQDAIEQLQTDVAAIQTDKSIVKNNYIEGETYPIVAKIVFITPYIDLEHPENNKTAEEVFEALVEKDPNTLYLIQEEE